MPILCAYEPIGIKLTLNIKRRLHIRKKSAIGYADTGFIAHKCIEKKKKDIKNILIICLDSVSFANHTTSFEKVRFRFSYDFIL